MFSSFEKELMEDALMLLLKQVYRDVVETHPPEEYDSVVAGSDIPAIEKLIQKLEVL